MDLGRWKDHSITGLVAHFVIRATEGGGPDELTGIVEFVARFKVDGKGHRLHEIRPHFGVYLSGTSARVFHYCVEIS